MEFRFRANDDRASSDLTTPSSDRFLTTQALQAGYIGGDSQRRDLLSNRVPSREAMRRELEKERIRDEIIAREIVRKRELEEEVRREMALEREIALRQNADRLFSDKRVLARHREVGDFERFSVKHSPERLEKEVNPIPEVSKREVVFLSKTASDPSLTGTKRKEVSETAGNETTCLSSSKKIRKEWSCALCQVSATCEEGLNAHLEGKKHKFKEAELGMGNKKADKPKTTSKHPEIPEEKQRQINDKKKMLNFWWCDLCKVGCNSEAVKVAHCGGKKHIARSQEGKDGGGKVVDVKAAVAEVVTREAEGIVESVKKKRLIIRCNLCDVQCNSETVMNDHCRGMKHIVRLQEVKEGEASEVVTRETDEEMEENLKKRYTFLCKLCQVRCNSESVMAAHCAGMKHIAMLHKTKEGVKKAEVKKEEIEGNVDGEVDGVNDVEAAKTEEAKGTEVAIDEAEDNTEAVEMEKVPIHESCSVMQEGRVDKLDCKQEINRD